MKSKKDLKPFGDVIQICPDCQKIDVYLNDGHTCDWQMEQLRKERLEYYD